MSAFNTSSDETFIEDWFCQLHEINTVKNTKSKIAGMNIFFEAGIEVTLKKGESTSQYLRRCAGNITCMIGNYALKKIRHAIYPFLLTIPQPFPYKVHRVRNNQPDIRQHIEVLHENPGILYIFQEL